MAWPSEAGSIAKVRGALPVLRDEAPPASSAVFGLIASRQLDIWQPNRGVHAVRAKALEVELVQPRSRVVMITPAKTKWYADIRGLWRIFNDAKYRIFQSSVPPVEGDSPVASVASLPHTLTDVYTTPDTQHYSVSRFNGVLDSGFYPVGANGETYLRFDVTGQNAFNLAPPSAPRSVRLEVRPAGVVRIVADYHEEGALRATEWAITYTTNGSTPGTPPAVSPTATAAMNTLRTALLNYDLPAQANGTTVKVRLQVRRNDSGTWRYSEGSTVLSATADAAGPSAPAVADRWRGKLPETG